MAATGRGKRGETLAFLALYKLGRKGKHPKPSWFLSVRRANQLEERQGYDLVIETQDVGILGLQVKVSKRIKSQQRRKYREKGIPVFRIPVEILASPLAFKGELFLEIQRLALIILEERRHAVLESFQAAHQ